MNLLEIRDELTEHAEVEVNQPLHRCRVHRAPLGQTKVLKEQGRPFASQVAPRLFGVVDVGKNARAA